MADKGIICCFDILGYQNIINTNQIEYVSKLIADKMCTLPENAKNILTEHFEKSLAKSANSNNLGTIVKELNDRIQYLSISDTLLVSLSIEDTITSSDIGEASIATFEFSCWVLFLLRIATLHRIYFDAGLPMRGAVDYGEFYIHENNFAGKPIIDSYVKAQQLNFSGCVLTPQAGNLLLEKLSKWTEMFKMDIFAVFKDILVPYLAPLKESSYEKLLLVNWYNISSMDTSQTYTDVRQYTNTAFHDHNKEIDGTVIHKIENTERILRWMKEKKWELNKYSLKQNHP